MTPSKPIAIIPARGGSKRLPRKNVAPLLGKPLLAYAVESALKSDVFDDVVVSSDDGEILDVARRYGATAIPRPPHLSTDTAQVRHVCRHILDEAAANGTDYGSFGVLLATNPLRTADDIRRAHDLFVSTGADAVMSLVAFAHPPQAALWAPDGFVRPYFGAALLEKQSQALDPLFRHDGTAIFCKSDAFRRAGDFYMEQLVPFYVDASRSVDIDRPLDFAWAEFLLQREMIARR